MPIDAYDPCPCGSGKKFKFCCSAVSEEIDKVYKYQETRQTQSSLQVLDRVLATKPELAWGYITKASILLNEAEYTGARESLVPFLEKTPDHPFGIALYATAAFASVGYENAKPAIYRAFQRCSSMFPDVVGSLAMGIAAGMFGRQKYMACRQFLAQAMRLVPDADKQDLFIRLLEFDSNGDLPYPLRSVHQLSPYTVPESAGERKEESQKLVHRAEALVAIGCFEPAAETYRQLAERDPETALLWQNAGLCWAWDGNEPRAAEALHRAAKFHQDLEAAAESETLAQLLDLNQPEAMLPVNSVNYRVSSVSRLLTLLDGHEQIVRLPDVSPGQRTAEVKTVTYTILDRPPLTEDPDLWPEFDEIPQSIAQLGIYEGALDREPQVFLSGLAGEPIGSARELFEALAADAIESTEEDEPDLNFSTAREFAPMLFTWHFPDKMPVVRQTQLEDRRWQENVETVWPNLRLAGLGGKTPNEAKGNPDLAIPLKAAIYVLDAFCDRNGHLIDLNATCVRFGVLPPTPIEPKPDLPLQSFSAMQLHRLNIPKLSDVQLLYVLNRMLLIHHGGFLRSALLEAYSRPGCREKIDEERTYTNLADLARERGDRDDTYHWIREGQKHAQTLDNAFERGLRWEMRELSFRAEDPNDPNLMPLVNRLVQKYAKKVPHLLEYVANLLTAYGIEPPANLAELAEQEAGTISSGGIWTPGQDAAEAGEKKIWLPGQS